MKNTRLRKGLFYSLTWIWNFPMAEIGLVVFLILMLFGYKPYKYGWCYCIEIGEGWGGLELGGMFFLTSKNPSKHTKSHEHGHLIQQLRFGPLQPFIVGIPSAIRYWYRELRYYRRGQRPTKGYDDIWFEGQATKLGETFIDILDTQKETENENK